MVEMAASRGADAIVFDLEDSVPQSEKDNARELVRQTLADWPADSATMRYVRINPPRMSMIDEDTAVFDSNENIGIVVPKVDRPVELEPVFQRVGRFARDVIVNIETPRSIMHMESFADTHGVGGLFLGGEDLSESMGMRRTNESQELQIPRFLLLAACRAAGIGAYDTVCPEFRDLDIVENDARTASSMGYDGKFAIHPAQVEPIHAAFTPSADEVEHAHRVVEAYDDAVAQGRGAVEVGGKMIDPPVAERARALLARSGTLSKS